MVAFLALLWKAPQVRYLGGFVLLPVILMMFLAGTVLYSKAQPLVPALQSYWLAIHVTLVSIAEGALMTSAVLTVLYLVKVRHDRSLPARAARAARWPTWPPGCPPPRRWTRSPTGSSHSPSRSTPWPSSAARSGPRRRGDGTGAGTRRRPGRSSSGSSTPCYLHARATAGWKGRTAAWVNLLGFGAITFNFLIVNIVVSGLHSYAGLS